MTVALPMKHAGEDWESGGGFVFPPDVGVHSPVATVDFSSLYPSITVGANISYETYRDEPGEDTVTIPGVPGPKATLDREIHFDQSEEGLVPRLVKKVWEVKKRTPGDDPLYLGSKIVLNALSYGVGNSPGSRLGRIEVGEAITGLGRDIIQTGAEAIEDEGYNVVGGDTDGVHVTLQTDDWVEETHELAELAEEAVRERVRELGVREPELFQLEPETISDPILITPERKYYAKGVVWDEGTWFDETKVVSKGLWNQRSDAAPFTWYLLDDVLEAVLADEMPPGDAAGLIGRERNRILDGEVEPHLVCEQKTMKRDLDTYRKPGGGWTSHVPEAIYFAQEFLDKRFTSGDNPYLLRLKKSPPGYEANYLALEEGDDIPEGFEPDWDHHASLVVDQKVTNIAAGLGIEEEVEQLGNQTMRDWEEGEEEVEGLTPSDFM